MNEITFPQRPHLDNSRALKWSCKAGTDAEQAAVTHLLALLEAGEGRTRQRREGDRMRLRLTLEAMVLDLYRSAKTAPDRFLAYSRQKGDYGGEGPTLTSVRTVVSFLEQAGFATTRLGSYSRRPNPFGAGEIGSGYLSRIRAEPLLVDTLEGVFGVTLGGIKAAREARQALIRLKAPPVARGASKRLLRFSETDQTKAMRERVAAGNALRAECELGMDGDAPAALDLADVHLHRVFNNGRWDHGGRFFGGWWQQMRKADRQRIIIDGEETVELDFRAHQPRLCFHLVGQPLATDADPYVLQGYDPAIYRDAAKRAFGRLLNSVQGAPVRRPAGTKGLFATLQDYVAFIAQVEAAFAPVQSWLRAGRGMEMQHIDSEIADAVLETLTAQRIPCLPVHDSFIVPRSAELALGRAMFAAYAQVLARLTLLQAVPAIAGWTSPSLERDALEGL